MKKKTKEKPKDAAEVKKTSKSQTVEKKENPKKKEEKVVFVAAPTVTKPKTTTSEDTSNKVVYKGSNITTNPDGSLTQSEKEKIRKDPYVYLLQEAKRPKTVKIPWYILLLIILIWLFILFCIMQFIITTYRYKDMRQWWKKNDGKKYKRVFSIEVLTLFNGFALGEKVYSLFLSEQAKIQSVGAGVFMTQLFYSYAKINDDDPIGFMLPYNFCESIAVGTYPTTSKPTNPQGLPEFTGYDDVTWDPDTLNEYNYPTLSNQWRLLLASWGAPQSKNDMTPDNSQKFSDLWTKTETNFLWQKYQISWDSPFILSFMFNTYTDPNGTEWTSNAFTFAVGINVQTGSDFGFNGGWWGYVTNGLQSQKDLTLGVIYQNLYTRVDYKPPATGPGCDGSAWGGASVSGLSSAFSTALMIAPLCGALTGGLGALAITGGAVLAGTLGFLSSSISSGCLG